jgi:hypothetical protein
MAAIVVGLRPSRTSASKAAGALAVEGATLTGTS